MRSRASASGRASFLSTWQPIVEVLWRGQPIYDSETPATFGVPYRVRLACGCTVALVEQYSDLDRTRGNEDPDKLKPPSKGKCPHGHPVREEPSATTSRKWPWPSFREFPAGDWSIWIIAVAAALGLLLGLWKACG